MVVQSSYRVYPRSGQCMRCNTLHFDHGQGCFVRMYHKNSREMVYLGYMAGRGVGLGGILYDLQRRTPSSRRAGKAKPFSAPGDLATERAMSRVLTSTQIHVFLLTLN